MACPLLQPVAPCYIICVLKTPDCPLLHQVAHNIYPYAVQAFPLLQSVFRIISYTGCRGHTAPSCTTSLPIYIHMLWPALSCNPSIRNISYTAGCRGQTAPSCTTSLIIYIHTRYKPAPSCNNISYAGCRGHTAPSCTMSLTIYIHMLWPALSCNSVRQCAW